MSPQPPMLPPFMGGPMQVELPPSMQGQLVIMNCQLETKFAPDGTRALVITPLGTNFQIVVPMQEENARQVATGLTSKHVVVPGAGAMPPPAGGQS